MKRKILQFILKRLKNSNYTSCKDCYECAVKRGSPQLCEQCYWVRENYKPNRIIFMNQQEEMLKRFDELRKQNDLWETYSKEGGYLLGKKEALANRNKEIVEIR